MVHHFVDIADAAGGHGFDGAGGDGVDADVFLVAAHFGGEVADGAFEGGFGDGHDVVHGDEFFGAEVAHGDDAAVGVHERLGEAGHGEEGVGGNVEGGFPL